MKCDFCEKSIPYKETFACLSPTCTSISSYSLSPDGQFDYKVLEVSNFCPLCVCCEHSGHVVQPLHKTDGVRAVRIESVMRELQSRKRVLDQKIAALSPPFDAMFAKASQ